MHSKRILFKDPEERKKLVLTDIEKGFENFYNHRKQEENKSPPEFMYI